ncbi:MAG: hypothetical protein ACTHM0_04810 [Sphingomonas sp.]
MTKNIQACLLVNKAGCLFAGLLWIAVFGFFFVALTMGDCPDAKSVCNARDNFRWTIWWIAAGITFAGMIWFFLYRPSKGGDDL